MSTQYSPYNHRSNTEGYQNIEIAQTFAKFVVDKVVKSFPDAKDRIVLIYCIDNSSTYLAAFVKMLMPHWFIVSGDKRQLFTKTNINSHHTKNEIICSIFLDDYFCSGVATQAFLDIINNSHEHFTNELMLFYIKVSGDAQEQVLNKLAKLGMIENVSFNVLQWID